MMKQLFTLCVLACLLSTTALAQNAVQKNRVLLEIFSGTWCVFCPGAALGADEMKENGHEIAIIEWHIGDDYETTEAAARDAYYNVTGYPSQVFDGTDQYSGGNATNSTYSTYLNRFNTAYSNLTPIDLKTNLDFVNGVVEVTAIVEQVASVDAAAVPTLYAVVTESHIPENWFFLHEINFTQRAMYPDASGVVLNLGSVGSSDTVNFQFTPAAFWDEENTDVVFYLQDPASKVVYNASLERLIRRDIELVGFTDRFEQQLNGLCSDSEIMPELIIKNLGGDTIKSMELVHNNNGGTGQALSWTGSLAFGKYDTVSLTNFVYTPDFVGTNSLQAAVLMLNGQSDYNNQNNSATTDWTYELYEPGMYEMEIRPDAFGSQITWELLDPAGAQLASGGPYNNFDTTRVSESFDLSEGVGCHEFRVYDSEGNGISSIYTGSFFLKDGLGNVVFESTDGDFGAEGGGNFELNAPATGLPALAPGLVEIYPNPTQSSLTLHFESFRAQEVGIEVFSLQGASLLKTSTQEGSQQIDLSQQAAGVYVVKIRTESGIHVEKVIKQ